MCPAMDLAASADALHEPRNRIYEYYFLMQLFRRLRLKARLFPEKFDVAALARHFQPAHVRRPHHRALLRICRSRGLLRPGRAANVVDRIAVPALIIHAANDPFIRVQPETVPASPRIQTSLMKPQTAATARFSANATATRPTTAAGPSAR